MVVWQPERRNFLRRSGFAIEGKRPGCQANSSMNSIQSVGIIGLGIIGAQVAAALRAAGYEVPVWNRTRKEVPNFQNSPADVVRAAEVIQLFVADPQAVYEVLEAMGPALTQRHTIICSATLGRDATLEAARRVAERGARFLDAPFTGSKEAAGKSQLLYYIGGDDAVLEAVRPVLQVSGGKGIVKIGAIGDAAVIKVVTNVLSAATVEVLAEMVAVVKKAGIAPEVLQKALENHGIRSGIIDMKLPKMIAEDYDTHFSLKHMLKDVRFGLDLGAELKLDLPVTATTEAAMSEGVAKGWGDLDFSSLYQRFA